MSFHFSLALVEEFSDRSCLDGELCAELKSIRTAEKSCFDGKKKATSRPSPSGMASRLLTGPYGEDGLTWLRQVFPVSPGQSQENEREKQTTATFGPTPSGSFARWDRDSACWKTYQVSLLTHTLEPFSETWPKRGSMRNGVCWERTMLEHRTEENGCGYWPTPRACDGDKGGNPRPKQRGDLQAAVRGGHKTRQTWPTPATRDWKDLGNEPSAQTRKSPCLPARVRMWATPNVPNGDRSTKSATKRGNTFYKDGKKVQEGLKSQVRPGALNPDWVEWLQGVPIAWTALDPLATCRFQAWCKLHGIYSQED